MFEIADLRERVVLSMATDLGIRIGDFVRIKKSDLPSLNQESPVSFDIMTRKEEVVAHGFLSEETVRLLTVYLPTLPENNSYLFPSVKKHISDTWINQLLQKLAAKARINTSGKSLSFHCFRKMLLSACIDSGIGLTAGKKLCGKVIPQSDDTYLTTVKLRERFTQLKEYITITKHKIRNEKDKHIEQMHQTIANQQTELQDLKTRVEALTHEHSKIEPLKQQLTTLEAHNETFKKDNLQLKEAVQTIAKTILSVYPVGSLYEKNGKLYEEKVVGIDFKTGKFIMESVETNEEMMKTWEEICNLIDSQDEEIRKILEKKNIQVGSSTTKE